MVRLEESLQNASNGILKKIKGEIGFDQFLIGRSCWSYIIIQMAHLDVHEDSVHSYEGSKLKAN